MQSLSLDGAGIFGCKCAMSVEINLEDARWNALDLAALADAAAVGVLTERGLDPERCEIAVLACDDSRIAALNHEFRGKRAPTNVLSWPSQDLAADAPGARPDPPEANFTGETTLGDIALAWETCAAEAAAAGRPLADHVAHLLVHGLLHLLGYDHVRDPDATLMEALETRILGTMGIDDPYKMNTGP